MKRVDWIFVVVFLAFQLQLAVFLPAASAIDNTGWLSADPCEKWRDWQKGPARVITPELRGGKASHSLSPAELIYYSAKENKINPILLMAIAEDQQRLVSIRSDVENGFDERLFFALNFATVPVVNWSGFYGGFYPQLVASSYILWANWLYGVPLDEVYSGICFYGDPESLKEIYAGIVIEISVILKNWEHSPYPNSDGYYLDFRGAEMSPEVIQKYLRKKGSSLANKRLFQQPASGETPACPG